jgi:tetratricopeptide (TPR) repeat protein
MHSDGKGDTPVTPSDDSGMTRYTAGTPSVDEPRTGSDPETATNYDLSARPAAPFAAGDAEGTNYNAKASPRKDGTPPGSGRPPGEPGPPAGGGDALPRRFGNYLLLEKIAEGGMGVVYKAQQLDPPRVVALKMILAGSFAAPSVMERFRIEARSVAVLDHPGIVPLYDFAEAEGKPYFTMAFVGGGSLQQLVKEGPLPARSAADVVLRIAEAVHYAHEKGVIHRDVKPSNILLQPREPHADGDKPTSSSGTKTSVNDLSSLRAALPVPRLTDFGLARRQDDLSARTASGEILGTPSYMAPEQAEGDPDAIGPATDVYGLGAVLYCLLTGRPPFQASSPLETLRQVREHEPVAPGRLNATVPRDLETICLKCLAKDPARRYASARLLADDLGRYLAGVPVLARPVGSLGKFVRWCRRYPGVASLTVAVVLALVCGVGAASYFAVLFRNKANEAEKARRDAEHARERALSEAEKTRWIEEILVAAPNDQLGFHTAPSVFTREMGEKRPIKLILRIAVFRATTDLARKPILCASVFSTVGRAYLMLGDRERAKDCLEKALKIRGENDAPREDVATSRFELGLLYENVDDTKCLTLVEAAQKDFEELEGYGPNHPAATRALRSKAWMTVRREDYPQAGALFQELAARCKNYVEANRVGKEHDDGLGELVAAEMGLVHCYLDQGKYPQGLLQASGALDHLFERVKDHPLAPAFRELNEAKRAFGDGNLPTVETHLRAALRLIHGAAGPEPWYEENVVRFFLAMVLERQGKGRVDEAAATYRDCIDHLSATSGYRNELMFMPLSGLARVLHASGKDSAADEEFQKFLDAQKELFSPDHVMYANAVMTHVDSLRERGVRPDLHEARAREAKRIYELHAERRWRRYRACLENLADACRRNGKAAEAADLENQIRRLDPAKAP